MVSFVKAINAMVRTIQAGIAATVMVAGVILAGMMPGPGAAAMAAEARLMVLGDSLAAGYGLPPGQGFPEQLERDLRAAGREVSVQNAGVSGDTTAGGVARLDWSLADNPQAVIIVLGGNDMLRGLPPDAARANLETIITRLLARDIEVLLAGMMAPRNMGPAYVEAFDAIYPALAARHDIEFYPFFLEGVALDPALNLDDGLHPNEAGIAEISRRIMPAVDRLLARLGG
jgi:acyl-CoA thioesterase-1